MTLPPLAVLVRDRRAELGLSFRDVAVIAGLSPALVHKIETGKIKNMPGRDTIDGLATALEMPADVLRDAALGRTDLIYEMVAYMDESTRAAAVEIFWGIQDGVYILAPGPKMPR